MEDTLRAGGKSNNIAFIFVLILVLMEDTLRENFDKAAIARFGS